MTLIWSERCYSRGPRYAKLSRRVFVKREIKAIGRARRLAAAVTPPPSP